MSEAIHDELMMLINSIKDAGDSHYKPPIATLHDGHTYIGLSPVMLEDMLNEIVSQRAKVSELEDEIGMQGLIAGSEDVRQGRIHPIETLWDDDDVDTAAGGDGSAT